VTICDNDAMSMYISGVYRIRTIRGFSLAQRFVSSPPAIRMRQTSRSAGISDPGIDITSTGISRVFHIFDVYWHVSSPLPSD
jgi:hypothetical protein